MTQPNLLNYHRGREGQKMNVLNIYGFEEYSKDSDRYKSGTIFSLSISF